MYSPDLDLSSADSSLPTSPANVLVSGAPAPKERKADVITKIQELVPIGAPEPTDPELLHQLRDLTQRLINAYKNEGCLQGDPFYDADRKSVV